MVLPKNAYKQVCKAIKVDPLAPLVGIHIIGVYLA